MRVSLGALAQRFALRCRPIKGFRFVYDDGRPLVAGGPPRTLHPIAVGLDDTPEPMLAGILSIADSAVAMLRDLTFQPRAACETMVRLDLGDCIL